MPRYKVDVTYEVDAPDGIDAWQRVRAAADYGATAGNIHGSPTVVHTGHPERIADEGTDE